jgi:hypothetical protein
MNITVSHQLNYLNLPLQVQYQTSLNHVDYFCPVVMDSNAKIFLLTSKISNLKAQFDHYSPSSNQHSVIVSFTAFLQFYQEIHCFIANIKNCLSVGYGFSLLLHYGCCTIYSPELGLVKALTMKDWKN